MKAMRKTILDSASGAGKGAHVTDWQLVGKNKKHKGASVAGSQHGQAARKQAPQTQQQQATMAANMRAQQQAHAAQQQVLQQQVLRKQQDQAAATELQAQQQVMQRLQQQMQHMEQVQQQQTLIQHQRVQEQQQVQLLPTPLQPLPQQAQPVQLQQQLQAVQTPCLWSSAVGAGMRQAPAQQVQQTQQAQQVQQMQQMQQVQQVQQVPNPWTLVVGPGRAGGAASRGATTKKTKGPMADGEPVGPAVVIFGEGTKVDLRRHLKELHPAANAEIKAVHKLSGQGGGTRYELHCKASCTILLHQLVPLLTASQPPIRAKIWLDRSKRQIPALVGQPSGLAVSAVPGLANASAKAGACRYFTQHCPFSLQPTGCAFFCHRGAPQP